MSQPEDEGKYGFDLNEAERLFGVLSDLRHEVGRSSVPRLIRQAVRAVGLDVAIVQGGGDGPDLAAGIAESFRASRVRSARLERLAELLRQGDPTVIARNDNLVSISSALEIDLTGQVCSDSMGYLFYSGIGDQVDFLRGSSMSKGGFSIIALPSTARNGSVSRIVSHLSEGAGVATTRGDVNFVITEYGIAELKGKGIYQRVMELAQIAHPKFREELIEVAKKRHYIFADQLPPTTEDLLFLEGYKNTLKLKNGKIVEFRPLLPSDEFAYRNFFYSLQEKTIYMRFFYKMRTFSHEVVQKQWSSVDYHKNMSIIGRVQKGGHKEIMAIGSYAADEDNSAEVAFVVREDFQGMGIATYLIEILEKIAKENHYTSFSASVLRENAAMIRVFKKRYPNAKISVNSGSDLLIRMDFADAVEHDNKD